MVKISVGNIKMGAIPSVSLPAGKTCRKDCPCYSKCYAAKLERLRKNVKSSYASNLDILTNEPEIYWREVEGAIMMSRFFRYHVSGDIVDYDYFIHMVKIAERNSHCQILCFTKKFDIVNKALSNQIKIPKNLHLIFSAWKGLKMVNPYNLPEAHIEYRDGTRTTQDSVVECSGNCTDCAKTNGGCWNLQNSEKLLIKEH